MHASPEPRIKINIDQPRAPAGGGPARLHGHLDLVGWAAANHKITAVEILVDGAAYGRAHHGLRTEGVAAAFPEFAHALFAGFRFVAASALAPGPHALRVVARDETGLEGAEEVQIEVLGAPAADGPWSLRRRMRLGEASLKLGWLADAAFAPQFLIVIADQPAGAAARDRTLHSLHGQVYPGWRLHDAAAEPPPAAWLIQLSPGDALGVDALLELALHLRADPAADFLYSDERRGDADGQMAPVFKPDWSPELLLSSNYIGRVWAASAALAQRAGIGTGELARAENDDLVLRLTEHARHIAHVPHVLCEAAPAAPVRERASLAHAIARRGIPAVVEPGRAAGIWHVRRRLAGPMLVSVIIPTAGRHGLIAQMLPTLRASAGHPSIEILVIDTVPDVQEAWKSTVRAHADQVIEAGGPFNWARLNNQAAAVAAGDLLLFLNDDVAFPQTGWLRAMMEVAQLPGAGAVGAQLLYPDGTVQHAGMFLTRTGARHAFHGLAGTAPGPFGLAMAQREVAAVTGACLMVSRRVFEKLGGFDERFDVACNDVDFCLRGNAAGFTTIYTPHASLIHHESVTRVGLADDHNEALFAAAWAGRLAAGDPWFNRHLSIAHGDYRAEPEPVELIFPARPIAAAVEMRKILAIKLDQMGDFITSLPALRRIKAIFPAAELTVLASPLSCDLAGLEPAIDRTLPFALFNPRSALGVNEVEPAALEALRRTLQEERFDLAIDLRCHAETRPILKDCGATWRAGFDAAFDFPWLDVVAVAEPDHHTGAKRTRMADTLLDLVEKLGAAFSPYPESAARPPAAPCARRRVCIHPGAGNAIRLWPAPYYADLITRLGEECACDVIVIGGADETSIGAEILGRLSDATWVTSYIGSTKAQDLAGIISACALFIGNNSGPHHLAARLGVPTISIHSGVVDAREWAASSPHAVAIRRRTTCSPCYLNDASDCPRGLTCLLGIAPREVLDLAKKALLF
jgi:ADP-heptose:LPS heptosyltransferase/GT2 family glycosyltransferase